MHFPGNSLLVETWIYKIREAFFFCDLQFTACANGSMSCHGCSYVLLCGLHN